MKALTYDPTIYVKKPLNNSTISQSQLQSKYNKGYTYRDQPDEQEEFP
ncbi:hypothetical protein HMPREF9372_1629 [Sporosarcina newyorkensis 2681]|uniref:Uncharacterized protein n=1 Tax=Sporosarcina newyorkensis 2681 TaxID=1027292 RepID=F9DS49_9BACL|nr:hypothetical protein HMPREF9372_1629 [Sporosarcina newyorkensis 2681]